MNQYIMVQHMEILDIGGSNVIHMFGEWFFDNVLILVDCVENLRMRLQTDQTSNGRNERPTDFHSI